ncbi:hypothetical protein SeLEV6574_g08361, partial [Synchytrium endobioticum]
IANNHLTKMRYTCILLLAIYAYLVCISATRLSEHGDVIAGRASSASKPSISLLHLLGCASSGEDVIDPLPYREVPEHFKSNTARNSIDRPSSARNSIDARISRHSRGSGAHYKEFSFPVPSSQIPSGAPGTNHEPVEAAVRTIQIWRLADDNKDERRKSFENFRVGDIPGSHDSNAAHRAEMYQNRQPGCLTSSARPEYHRNDPDSSRDMRRNFHTANRRSSVDRLPSWKVEIR